MKTTLRTTFCILVLLSLGSWGFFVHRMSPQLATYYLPKAIQPFFFANLDKLVYDSVRPDVRRNKDPLEAPRHYIDIDFYGESAVFTMPERWEDATQKYTADTLTKYGTLPWRVFAMQAKLTEAMRTGNKDSILYYAAEVCHYVGDAHVPLHTTLNYDGQLTKQRGIHALWESTLPEMDIAEYKLRKPHRPKYLKDTQAAIWKVIRTTHTSVAQVLEEERIASENIPDSVKYRSQTRNGRTYKNYTSFFARAYSQRLSESVQERCVATAQCLADFWYTAWIDAGKPTLPVELNPTQKEQFLAEKKAWKQNKLLEKGLLRAKKGDDAR